MEPQKAELMNPTPAISRRSMLRASGALMALPFFESLFPARVAAANVGRPPVRFGIFTVTGGTVIESWKLKEAGPLTKLPSILRPLEFAKDHVTVISGLCHSGRSDNLNRGSRVLDQWLHRFVERDQRPLRIEGALIDVEHFFHLTDELGVGVWRPLMKFHRAHCSRSHGLSSFFGAFSAQSRR